MRLLLSSALLFCATFVGCASGDLSPYELEMAHLRYAKNAQLFNPETSILEPAKIADFKGLRFFDVDSSYRYSLPLVRAEQADTVKMLTQTQEVQSYVKVGYIEVPLAGEQGRLFLFRNNAMATGEYWIPFRDATTGRQTYGGGRYLDVNIVGDTAHVDFNKAYNPYCDYNPDYICPLAPPENTLSAAIEAGEMASELHVDP